MLYRRVVQQELLTLCSFLRKFLMFVQLHPAIDVFFFFLNHNLYLWHYSVFLSKVSSSHHSLSLDNDNLTTHSSIFRDHLTKTFLKLHCSNHYLLSDFLLNVQPLSLNWTRAMIFFHSIIILFSQAHRFFTDIPCFLNLYFEFAN